jgi:type III pantothenate kinase
MQGIVTLDFGNSNPHAGLFSRKGNECELLKVVPFSELAIILSQIGMTPDNTSLVLCEVKAREENLTPLLEKGYLLTRVKDYWRGKKFAGMTVNYAETLGEDRLIEAFFTFKKDKTPTLIIDAGTYVTMDIVTDKGFLGGYIIPNLKTYLETFKSGEQLKNVSLNEELSPELPQETKSAMSRSYLAFGALANNLIEQHGIRKVLLTGGQGASWQGVFEDSRPSLIVENNPHLIHSSLAYWFTTQIEPL